jgi:hypothetical protein
VNLSLCATVRASAAVRCSLLNPSQARTGASKRQAFQGGPCRLAQGARRLFSIAAKGQRGRRVSTPWTSMRRSLAPQLQGPQRCRWCSCCNKHGKPLSPSWTRLDELQACSPLSRRPRRYPSEPKTCGHSKRSHVASTTTSLWYHLQFSFPGRATSLPPACRGDTPGRGSSQPLRRSMTAPAAECC